MRREVPPLAGVRQEQVQQLRGGGPLDLFDRLHESPDTRAQLRKVRERLSGTGTKVLFRTVSAVGTYASTATMVMPPTRELAYGIVSHHGDWLQDALEGVPAGGLGSL